MNKKIIIILALFFSVISTGLCFGGEYETEDGYIVDCGGVDANGHYVPCPGDDDDTSSNDDDNSWVDDAKKEYEDAKERFNTDNWLDSDD